MARSTGDELGSAAREAGMTGGEFDSAAGAAGDGLP